MMAAPILVTGSAKSGTTWVGQMLAASGQLGYIREPFNPERPLGISGIVTPDWHMYVPPDLPPDSPTGRALQSTLAYKVSLADVWRRARHRQAFRDAFISTRHTLDNRRRHLRPLLKDPIAIFAAEWLARAFDVQVVVMIRHPAAFVHSYTRAGWVFDFRNFVRQPLLMEHYLKPFAEEIHTAVKVRPDPLDGAALLWRVIYHTVWGYQQRHPSWQSVRHEDLSLDPVREFRALFHHLDLPFSSAAEAAILKSTSGQSDGWLQRDSRQNVGTWRAALRQEEIERIRRQVDDVSSLFYSDADWVESELVS
jgi:hypothetical protein